VVVVVVSVVHVAGEVHTHAREKIVHVDQCATQRFANRGVLGSIVLEISKDSAHYSGLFWRRRNALGSARSFTGDPVGSWLAEFEARLNDYGHPAVGPRQ